MATIPDDLRYTEQHEWARRDGDTITVGITDVAAGLLGDIVFVQLPNVGDTVTAGEACGEVESTKSVSDIYAPVSGTVTEVNPAIDSSPETVGADPYGEGWLFRVAAPDADLDALLDAAAYRQLTEEA
ncbi:glycine cleavage system protein GcvH [Pseudonocardia thermophila]|jgi:glycine cleavage system H protein|uniref:glycine cleavage system protein GcvH n=1 Tax=Pseudonocardia thermophila TaxID=1848 RepID=UPI00248E097D|nr:glycine cleavage system protein GcvH [Pseudonocardia thermophila]